MGCNIHIFVERGQVYSSNNQTLWYGFGDNMRASTCYPIFGAIAGVVMEDDIDPIAEPRGYPPDYGNWNHEEKDPLEFHSWTYLSPNELEEAIKRTEAWMAENDYEDDLVDYKIILEFCRDNERAGYEVRLVIGFDS